MPWFILSGIVALALALRLLHLADIADSPFYSHPVVDGRAYDHWATAIAQGTASTAPFYQDPLYPHLLAVVYRVAGHSYTTVYLLQIVLGLTVVLLVFDCGRMLFDIRGGLVAAALSALYGPVVFYEGQIEKTVLGTFLVAIAVWSTVRMSHSTCRLWPATAGMALGLGSLVRANLLPFGLLLAVFSARPGRTRTTAEPRPWRRRLADGGLVLAGLLAATLPVAIRNSLLAGEPLLTTTQAGQNLYIGNGPHNTSGQYEAPAWVRATPEYEEADFRAHAESESGRRLSFSGVSAFYSHKAVRWALAKPGEFVTLLARKTLLYFSNLEVPDSQDIGFFSRYSWVIRLPLVGFGLAFALGFTGMLLSWRRSATHRTLTVFFFGYAASVITFFVLGRYRVPSLPALLPFAGGTATWLASQITLRRLRSFTLAVGLIALVLVGTHISVPVGGRASQHAQSLVNLAATYYRDGHIPRAITTYREALAADPGHTDAARSLGIILAELGQADSAESYLEIAKSNAPGDAMARYHLGRVREALHKTHLAATDYQQAVRLRPEEPRYRFALATALQKLNRHDLALAQYDTVLELAPDNPRALHNRAVALYHLGRPEDARRTLERVRQLGGPVSPDLENALRQSGQGSQ